MPVRVPSLFLSQGLLAVFSWQIFVGCSVFWRNKKLFQLIYLIHKFHAMFAILIPTIVSMYKLSYIL